MRSLERAWSAVVLVLAVLVGSPATADVLREWYDYYGKAEKDIAGGRCKEALASLNEAIRLKPRSGLQERTYGLDFVDNYLPYYYQGVCHLRLNDYSAALRSFAKEEEQGLIKKSHRYAELVKLRNEAVNRQREEAEHAEQERNTRAALEQVQRLRREADELYTAGKLEEALAQLASAEKAADLLNPGIRQQIVDKAQKIRHELNERRDQVDRAQRVVRGLEDGARLLEEGKSAEAKRHFDDVLMIDPSNAKAREGKQAAEEAIRAYTTHQDRLRALEEGKALYEAGEYEKALPPLTEAEADPGNAEARDYLHRVRAALEGVRKAKALHVRIEGLYAAGDKLLQEQRYPEAMVKLTEVVELDPTDMRAKARLRVAERLTRDAIFEMLFPNQEPLLTFLELPPAEIEAPNVALIGLATDDRGLVRIEYRLNGGLVAERTLSPNRSGALDRSARVEQVFALEPGANVVSVSAVDTNGVAAVNTFTIERRLRFYETRAFLPSAALSAVALVGGGLLAQQARRRRAIRKRFNPYIAGAPVMDDDMFFGREKLLGRIMNVLHHNSLMITGERRIGKTTFLYHLKKALETDQATEYRFFPVFTDLQGVPEETFFHALIADVVEGLDLPPEVAASLRYRPDDDDERYDGRDFSHDLQRVIEHLKSRTDKRVKLALLIDEVDVLNDYSERVNQRLRGIFMKTFSEHLVAIMSGVGIKRTWTSEGSPWYNFFDQIELQAFTREEAEALVRQPVEGVFRFEPEAVEKILAKSQLKPYVIQKYCIHAVNLMIEEGRTTVTVRDVDAVTDAVQAEEPEDGAPALPRQVTA